jgi:hypothetical protein
MVRLELGVKKCRGIVHAELHGERSDIYVPSDVEW